MARAEIKITSFAIPFALLAVDTPADVDFFDLANEPTDVEYDAMADEAAVLDLMEAGIASW